MNVNPITLSVYRTIFIFLVHLLKSLTVNHWNVILSRGRTYVMITYVSKENNLGPDDKIRYIWGR